MVNSTFGICDTLLIRYVKMKVNVLVSVIEKKIAQYYYIPYKITQCIKIADRRNSLCCGQGKVERIFPTWESYKGVIRNISTAIRINIYKGKLAFYLKGLINNIKL